jgi:hypothetical protein
MSAKRNKYLLAKWGITLEQYNEILEGQGGLCPICLTRPEGNLCVDHDHVTRRIRGLLCAYCNRYRVGRHRDANIIQRVADYLRGGTDYYAPEKKRRRSKSSRRRKRTKKA